MTISVLIATYGSDDWRDLALHRAFPTADTQDAEVILHHDPRGTVSSSRNAAAERSSGDWLCFLDGDDQLGHGYINQMRQATIRHPDPRMLFTPAISYVKNGRPKRPMFWPECRMQDGNWLVIGTLVHRTLFNEVGGFRDYGDPPGSNAFEDYAMWARCIEAGARVVKVPRAVYIAHIDRASRHRRVSAQVAQAWHREIREDIWPDLYPAQT